MCTTETAAYGEDTIDLHTLHTLDIASIDRVIQVATFVRDQKVRAEDSARKAEQIADIEALLRPYHITVPTGDQA